MDKRPPSERREAKVGQMSEIDEVEGAPQGTEASAGEDPVTEDGKDDPSELSKFRVYVLFSGNRFSVLNEVCGKSDGCEIPSYENGMDRSWSIHISGSIGVK